ncbi:sugar phosphate nucleotidyltransferase [Acidianus brierleyi]|uniref:sugar phosphate nucleotidyltransferase n=1 Tax=Acidianus brierleyi TaxID=41673 RepID=UPI0014431812|nr:NDP-sugar synthase [Acidianus brierleyi]AWR94875.2 NTP transferase domain-containing protein [Acidianus brierleyi]
MKAVILAGGSGEGLSPFTQKEQKESISILGRSIISYTLEGLKKAGIKEAIVIVNEKQKQIEESISTDISIEFVRQKRNGISGAALDGMEKAGDDEILLAFGDIIASSDFYISLMNVYALGAKAVFSLVPVYEGMQTYGLAKIKNDRIEIVKEGSTLALAGAYILPYGDFNNLLEYFTKLAPISKFFVWSGNWIDIGYPEDLLNAIELLLRNSRTIISNSANISKTALIGSNVVIDDNAVVEDYAIIKGPTYIGKNAYIGSYSLIRDFSSIEEKSSIGAYCEVSHSLIEPYSDIGSKSYVTYSIIGKRAKIGASVITSNYPANIIRGKVNKLGALISPEETISHGSVLPPNYRK